MPIRLQDRDKYLLDLLADDFLLLSREQIQELIPRGIRRTNQRLALLTGHGLLSRRDPVDRLSPSKVFYFLGEDAVDVLNVDEDPSGSAGRGRGTSAIRTCGTCTSSMRCTSSSSPTRRRTTSS